MYTEQAIKRIESVFPHANSRELKIPDVLVNRENPELVNFLLEYFP